MTNEKLKAELAVFGTVEKCELVSGLYETGELQIVISNYDFTKKGSEPAAVLKVIYKRCECWNILNSNPSDIKTDYLNKIFKMEFVSNAHLFMFNNNAPTDTTNKHIAFSNEAVKRHYEENN